MTLVSLLFLMNQLMTQNQSRMHETLTSSPNDDANKLLTCGFYNNVEFLIKKKKFFKKE